MYFFRNPPFFKWILTRTWANDSYYYWDEIRKSAFGSLAGVAQLSSYTYSNVSPDIVRVCVQFNLICSFWLLILCCKCFQHKHLERLLPVYRPATPEELKLCPGNWKFGSFFTTLLTECSIYQPWASERYLIQKVITNL